MPALFLVFKSAVQTHVEGLVSWFSGPYIHVDIVPGDTRVAFTSYMFERFSANSCDHYRRSTHACLSLQVTQEEHDRVVAFLARQVALRTPYNYSDVFRCMLPGPIDPVTPDVAHEDAITSLYCSQAAVLALRWGLTENVALLETIAALHSRFTTPQMLWDALEPHAEPADTFFAT